MALGEHFLINLILGAFEKLGRIVSEVIAQKVAEYKLKKAVKERIKEIKREKDAAERARRMRDALNSI